MRYDQIAEAVVDDPVGTIRVEEAESSQVAYIKIGEGGWVAVYTASGDGWTLATTDELPLLQSAAGKFPVVWCPKDAAPQ